MPDLPDISKSPYIQNKTESFQKRVSNLVKLHNSELKIALDDFKTTNPSVKIFRFPTAEWMDTLFSSKLLLSQLGITDITDPCSDLSTMPPTVCVNSGSYVFWDYFHTTTKISKFFAKSVFESFRYIK